MVYVVLGNVLSQLVCFWAYFQILKTQSGHLVILTLPLFQANEANTTFL